MPEKALLKYEEKFLYGDFTWPECKRAVEDHRVIIVPVGTVEDHGYHLPIDTDNMICWETCLEVGKRIPTDVAILPLIPFGINPHHMDFPGGITLSGSTLIAVLKDVGRSLAHHGFKRVILLNSHGSNRNYVGLAAREIVVETEILCVSTAPSSLVSKEVKKKRKSLQGEGISHACEEETAVYLYRYPEKVQMDKAVKEWGLQPSEFFGWDRGEKMPVEFMDFWSRVSKSGVVGDPTVADSAYGKEVFESTVNNLIAFIKEFKTWTIRPRCDHHL